MRGTIHGSLRSLGHGQAPRAASLPTENLAPCNPAVRRGTPCSEPPGGASHTGIKSAGAEQEEPGGRFWEGQSLPCAQARTVGSPWVAFLLSTQRCHFSKPHPLRSISPRAQKGVDVAKDGRTRSRAPRPPHKRRRMDTELWASPCCSPSLVQENTDFSGHFPRQAAQTPAKRTR